MKHNFLKSLNLPRTQVRLLPTVRLEEGLCDWETVRSKELERVDLPDYRYYLRQLYSVTSNRWEWHDRMFDLEQTQIESEEDEVCYARLSFAALDEYPARILGSVAYQMGYRLIPYARNVAKRVGDPSLAHYIELHCRQWAEEADVVFNILEGKKLNARNAASQIALIAPVRQRARTLITLIGDELADYCIA